MTSIAYYATSEPISDLQSAWLAAQAVPQADRLAANHHRVPTSERLGSIVQEHHRRTDQRSKQLVRWTELSTQVHTHAQTERRLMLQSTATDSLRPDQSSEFDADAGQSRAAAGSEFARGQRHDRGLGHVHGDFATGMRTTSRSTVTGDFATGTRTSHRATAFGDFATGMRTAHAAVTTHHHAGVPGELPLAA